MLSKDKSYQYLETIQNIKESHSLVDIHVHPYEVFSPRGRYYPYPANHELYTKKESVYSPPTLTDLVVERQKRGGKIFDLFSSPEIIRRNLCRLYAHTGPQVFTDQMSLSGIDRVLLLPVAPPEGSLDSQMNEMKYMFGDDARFLFGWSVANFIKNHEILKFMTLAVSDFDIKAVKLHPNVTQINLQCAYGLERVESLVEACGQLRIPLIVHGGRSPLLRNSEAFDYAAITNLKNINWSTSKTPVCIAHAASYGYDLEEIRTLIVPTLNRMLSIHSNLFVDLSGLDIEKLLFFLNRLDTDRILFGSDTLYEPQWVAMVKLLHALSRTTKSVQEAFLRIVCFNPARFLSEGPKRYKETT